MNPLPRRWILVLAALVALGVRTAVAAPAAPLNLPQFDSLAAKASETVNVSLDASLLGLAAGFLDPSDPQDAGVKELIAGLKGIYVRSYTFDRDMSYPEADIEALRRQLAAPGWQSLIKVRKEKERTNVDIYISTDAGKANGLAIIVTEPREFTVVNIVGSIDLQKLRRLEGKFGVPKIPLPPDSPAPPGAPPAAPPPPAPLARP
ncbi:MAG TPA: DUF4252 domain-containing protein [Steroidobacteraceae bacterium]|jgi:hypothetical protein|nr:DUF4252 domain-containing protein [Steroidobacteraceae bacterium]